MVSPQGRTGGRTAGGDRGALRRRVLLDQGRDLLRRRGAPLRGMPPRAEGAAGRVGGAAGVAGDHLRMRTGGVGAQRDVGAQDTPDAAGEEPGRKGEREKGGVGREQVGMNVGKGKKTWNGFHEYEVIPLT